MKNTILSIFGFLLVFLLAGAFADNAPSVKVWSPDFTHHHMIDDPEKIKLIVSAWSSAEKENKANLPSLGRELYKIDFSSALSTHNGRWLYNKEGYFRFLSKTQTQVFKANEPGKLNELLGI
jgi:hypothetical protein